MRLRQVHWGTDSVSESPLSYTGGLHDSLDGLTGINNLLCNCLDIKPGESLLIIAEPEGSGFYEEGIDKLIAKQAAAIGAVVQILRPPLGDAAFRDSFGSVFSSIRTAHHTLFLSRLGDKLRFSNIPGSGSKTMSYTPEFAMLDAEYAAVPWGLFQQVHDRVLATMAQADSYRITCPLGTQLSGRARGVECQPVNDTIAPFAVKLFPVLIYPPLRCIDLEGQIVLGPYLSSTSINHFENSSLKLEHPVTAHVEGSRIVRFEGDPGAVAAVQAQYQRVGKLSGGNQYTIHSWHTGIYPKTFYSHPIDDDIERWSDLVFGSPRYTHFHTCGKEPGNISAMVVDATIWFDDDPIWEAGRFVFLDRPEQQALLGNYLDHPGAFDMCWDIGL